MSLPNGQNQSVKIDQDDVVFATCKCFSNTFIEAHKLGKLSPIHPKNPTGKEQLVPFPVMVCTQCGKELKTD